MWTRDTIEALYERHAYALYQRCRQLLRDSDGARDVMHEVFVHVLRSPDHFEGRSGVATYLYGVATRLCLNRLRNDRARGEQWLTRLGNHTHVDEAPGVDPVELRQLATSLLGEADDETALMALYHFADGLSQGEVAALVGRSRVTVNQKLRAFRENARAKEEP